MTAKKNRIGISLRSKSEWETAWNEEALTNKNTGEMLIKSYDGQPISYMYLNRLDQHIDNFSDKIIDMGMSGNLYMIDNESKNILPEKIDFNTNILENIVELGGSTIEKLMLGLSYNSFVSNGLVIKFIDSPIKYNIDIYKGDNVIHTITHTITSEEMLTNIINIKGLNLEYDKVVLRDISIQKPDVDDEDIKNIVHGLLIFIEGGVVDE